MGEGSYGELGIGTELYRLNSPHLVGQGWERLQKIANGGKHSLAVMKDGRLFSWGSGKFGVQGSDDHANVLSPQTLDLDKEKLDPFYKSRRNT